MWIRIKYFTFNCFPESSFLVKKGQNRYSKKNNFPYRRTDGQTFEIKQKSKNRLKYSKRVNGKKKFSRFHMIVF